MENTVNSVGDTLQEIDQNTQRLQLQSLQNEKFQCLNEEDTTVSIHPIADLQENCKSTQQFSPSIASLSRWSDAANRVLKRPGEDGEDGDDKGSVNDRETTPMKRSRAKKMQGLTHEQAELRRSRTNEQERERQRNISEAMEALKKCDMPFNPYLNNKEDSKIYLLKTATAYIYALSRMLDDHDRGLVHRCEHSLSLGHYGDVPNGADAFGTGATYDAQGALGSQRFIEDHSNNMAMNYTSTMTKERLEANCRGLTATEEQRFTYRCTEQSVGCAQVLHQNTLRQCSYTRNYDETGATPEVNVNAHVSNEGAPHLSSTYPSFLQDQVGYRAEVRHTQPLQCSPSESPFRHLDESLLCQTPQGRISGLTVDSILRKNIENPSYHSTPLLNCTLSPDTKGSMLCLGTTPTTSLGQLPLQTSSLGREVTGVNHNSSANSSGYVSMLSAPGDNDSRVFSPERLHQTIEDMYSESFLAPTSTLQF